MPLSLAGDPAALRAAAARLRGSRRTAEDAARRVQASHDSTAGSWTGQAAAACGAAAAITRERLRVLAALADAAEPLEAYADELEAAQTQWDAHFATAAYGYGSTGYEAAVRALGEARDRADAANARAAEEIERVGRVAEDGLTGPQSARFAGSQVLGGAGGLAVAWNTYLAGNATDRSVAAARSQQAAALTHLGRVTGGLGAGAGQLLRDADNPRYSDAERVGRAVGQGLTVGGAAAAGALLGSVVPGAGTILGALAGTVVGMTAGYLAADAVDRVNDDIVDDVGEAFDDLDPSS
jgi:uncharacterized protein YukE